MNMDMLKQEKNRGYVIAGIAAIVGFIAFFLPYVSASYLTFSASASGASGGWLWFEEIAALVAIAAAAVLIFRNNAFGLTNMPVEKQIQYGRYVLLGAGVLALLIHLLFLIDYQSSVGDNLGGVTTGLSVGLGFGYWVFMLAAIAMIVGAVMALRSSIPAAGMAQTYGQYGQQYPPQPTQYPPYQQPYPPADQQQAYPPYQQPQQPYQVPPQQYPAQPQQPYQYPPQQPQQYPPAQPQQYPPTELQQPPQQYPPQR